MSNFDNFNLHKLKNDVKTEAKSLGFSHIGVTSSSPPNHADIFLDWLEKGYAASMSYLERQDTITKRLDPQKILESCESIIMLALPYMPSIPVEDDSDLPRVASYAVGDDYHNVIPNLLETLIFWIKEQLNVNNIEYRIYTDTGPILEREFASRAGLGWIGKNSCLIHPDSGSYFFLAEILINIPFEPDLPFDQDYCGTCNKCVESCPTRCILPNRTIDSNRCISFLTIENRKEISEDLRSTLNGWVFGCDICQQVCPWNIRFSKNPEPNYFQPIDEVKNLKVLDLLTIGPQEFKAKFSNSPISRTKINGLKRNLLNYSAYYFKNELINPIRYIIKNEEDDELVKLAKWVLQRNDIGF